MARRVEYVSVDEARRLGRECGIGEAQASRSAFRMLANHPDLVKHVYGLLTMLSSRNKLPTRLRELIIMRLAWRAGSEYAWFQHYRISTQAGITPEEIVAVRDWRKSELFGPAERAVLAAADDTCERGKGFRRRVGGMRTGDQGTRRARGDGRRNRQLDHVRAAFTVARGRYRRRRETLAAGWEGAISHHELICQRALAG